MTDNNVVNLFRDVGEAIPIPGILLNFRPIPICYPVTTPGDYVRFRQQLRARGYRLSEDREMILDDGWDPAIYDRNFQIMTPNFQDDGEIVDFILELWENLDGIFCFNIRRDYGLHRLQFRFASGYLETEELLNIVHRFWNGYHKLPQDLDYFFDEDMEIPDIH